MKGLFLHNHLKTLGEALQRSKQSSFYSPYNIILTHDLL